MINRLLVFTAVFCFFTATASKSSASPDSRIRDAQAAAQAWVSEIDAGRYDDSYADTSSAMQQKVPKDHWVLVLKTLRVPWGAVVSRKEASHVYKPDGLEGLPGECVVITYDTSFKKMDPATEVIVLKWEEGKWLGAGYNAGPKPKPVSDQSAEEPPPQTEVSTATKTLRQTQDDQSGK